MLSVKYLRDTRRKFKRVANKATGYTSYFFPRNLYWLVILLFVTNLTIIGKSLSFLKCKRPVIFILSSTDILMPPISLLNRMGNLSKDVLILI